MKYPEGVLPDEVARNPLSTSTLLALSLRDDLSREEAIAWLQEVTRLVSVATAEVDGHQLATVTVGLTSRFFGEAAAPRFGLDALDFPADFASLPDLGVAAMQADVVVYVFALADSVISDLVLGLWRTRPAPSSIAAFRRGFQRANRREQGGFLDGLRNLENNRESVFITDDGDVIEPDWCRGGTYGVYLKIQQNLDSWNQLSEDEQNNVIGRRKSDGSRLDLPEGTKVDDEGAPIGAMPNDAHVRKVGPRDGEHDRTAILRRGSPYLDVADGAVDTGLLFVSYQASLDDFDVVFNTWLKNVNFPVTGANADRLFAGQFATVLEGVPFFVPPRDGRFIAAGLFDRQPNVHGKRLGRVIVQKIVQATDGTTQRGELSGFKFQARLNGEVVAGPVTTNAAGRAVLRGVPMAEAVQVQEIEVPETFDPPPPQDITIGCRVERLEFINKLKAPSDSYANR